MALTIYRGKTVLITGDTGFKGSWLSLWLISLGAKVVGFALPPIENGNYTACDHAKRFRHEDSMKGSRLIIGENCRIDAFVKIKFAGGWAMSFSGTMSI